MSRYDYPDPGSDPSYCNPLSAEDDEREDEERPDLDGYADEPDPAWMREEEAEELGLSAHLFITAALMAGYQPKGRAR